MAEMNSIQSAVNVQPGKHAQPRSTEVLAWLLAGNFSIAILTLWIQAFWPVALFEIISFLIAFAALFLSNKKKALCHTLFPLLVLGWIVLWGCIQLITGWTSVRFETINAIWKWLTWFAVYYAGISIFTDIRTSERFRLWLVWFSFAVAIEAILQAFITPDKIFGIFPAAYQEYVMGPILYHTHFAVYIETVLPISLVLGFTKAKKSYTFLEISAVLLAAIIVSASRGGLIIALIELATVFLLLRPWKDNQAKQTGALALAFTGTVLALVLIVGFDTILDRFRTETFISGRTQFALSSLAMMGVHPLSGFGLGCWPEVYPAFARFDPGAFVNQAHSDWLQWMAEGGIPIGIAMFSLVLWAIKPAVKSLWGIGAIAVFIHAAFDYPFSRPAIGALPFLILAMTAVQAKAPKHT